MPKSEQPRKPYRPRGKGVWDGVNQTLSEARNLQYQALSCVNLIKAKMESGEPYDREKLTAEANTFNRLLTKYNDELNKIDQSRPKQHGDIRSNDELVMAIDLGQQSRLWVERWMQDVLPVMNGIFTLIKA